MGLHPLPCIRCNTGSSLCRHSCCWSQGCINLGCRSPCSRCTPPCTPSCLGCWSISACRFHDGMSRWTDSPPLRLSGSTDAGRWGCTSWRGKKERGMRTSATALVTSVAKGTSSCPCFRCYFCCPLNWAEQSKHIKRGRLHRGDLRNEVL